jgi:undecaprenyl-diphosphatase
METWQAIVLGVIQGLTEFLPVSSSGHLVLVEQFYQIQAGQPIFFELVLHVGTLLAILLVYRVDLKRIFTFACYRAWLPEGAEDVSPLRRWQTNEEGWLIVCILVASVPTALIGLKFEDTFEQLFSNPIATGAALLLTGGLLMATRLRQATVRDTITAIPLWVAFVIGIVQGLAITPGISRSGATIAVALLLGVGRESAGKFSFLLSVPAIIGALAIRLAKNPPVINHPDMINSLFLGLIMSYIFGYLALRLLLGFVKQGRLHWWSWYCWAVGAFALLWFGVLGK